MPSNTYDPFSSFGSAAVANGSDSRSDHFRGFVGSYPALVRYSSNEPLCGAVARKWKVWLPAAILVDGQSARGRSSPLNLSLPALHSLPSGINCR